MSWILHRNVAVTATYLPQNQRMLCLYDNVHYYLPNLTMSLFYAGMQERRGPSYLSTNKWGCYVFETMYTATNPFFTVKSFTQERKGQSYLSTSESEDAMSLRQCTLLPSKFTNVKNFTHERRSTLIPTKSLLTLLDNKILILPHSTPWKYSNVTKGLLGGLPSNFYYTRFFLVLKPLHYLLVNWFIFRIIRAFCTGHPYFF